MPERRKLARRTFSYYMRLMNESTGELVGHLADISTGGFKMESLRPIPLEVDFRFRIELTSEVADVPFMVFGARSKWCQRDNIDYSIYDVGFQITHMSPSDTIIFSRMFERYGTKSNQEDNPDYLWR
ncbi:MAG TPA: PilZ domain-containing protein [Anaerolineales bacterium]|nr:PilZ domain-containing protein [Anaerolineales bacterium]